MINLFASEDGGIKLGITIRYMTEEEINHLRQPQGMLLTSSSTVDLAFSVDKGKNLERIEWNSRIVCGFPWILDLSVFVLFGDIMDFQ